MSMNGISFLLAPHPLPSIQNLTPPSGFLISSGTKWGTFPSSQHSRCNHSGASTFTLQMVVFIELISIYNILESPIGIPSETGYVDNSQFHRVNEISVDHYKPDFLVLLATVNSSMFRYVKLKDMFE